MKAGAFLDATRDKGWLDAADLRLVAMLRELAAPQDGDDDRAFTIVITLLCRACAEGSLCLPLEAKGLEGALRGPLSAGGFFADDASSASAAETIAARFLAAADAGSFAAALGAPEAPRPLIRAHGNLYLHRFWFAERTVADNLAARQRDASAQVPEDTLASVLRGTLDALALAPTDRQREALETALRSPIFVLTGGPGTGKTTWTAAWLRAVLRLPGVSPERVRLCAPTGRAARRLEESLKKNLGGDEAARAVPVTTLHALLGYRAFEGRFARGPEDPVDADWILLDEASMADAFLMAALVRALRPGARLVLAGDPDQLPAVEAGSLLAELLPEAPGARKPVPSVTLDAGHRAQGTVAALADAVRAGDTDAVLAALGGPASAPDAFAGRSVARIEVTGDDARTLGETLRAYAVDVFGTSSGAGSYETLLHRFRTLTREEEPGALDALWERAGRARVLAPLRRGPVSADGANRILRARLEPGWRRPADARGPGFHGAPILITRNDERAGLSNGDVGLWLETADGAAAFFPRAELPGGWMRLPVALLPACELGFASTVHKSQGSECDAVLVLLPDPESPLLARETLYTAITRARNSVRIYGPEASIRRAVERKMTRYGGLRKMLNGEG